MKKGWWVDDRINCDYKDIMNRSKEYPQLYQILKEVEETCTPKNLWSLMIKEEWNFFAGLTYQVIKENCWIGNERKLAIEVFPEMVPVMVKRYKESLFIIEEYKRERLKERGKWGWNFWKISIEKRLKEIRKDLTKWSRYEMAVNGVEPVYNNKLTLDQIKEKPITEIMEEYGFIPDYKGIGRAKYKCPLHNEKTASFSVNTEKNYFKCFGCGAGGSVIDLVMGLEDCNCGEAIKKLSK